MKDVVEGPDGKARCPWAAGTPDYLDYHDSEWGRPLHGESELYERLTLEAFQSGLSWLTILRKRESFRRAFDGFEIEKVAGYGARELERLMGDAGIVRNRKKIEAAISNAKAALELHARGETLDELLWSFAPDSKAHPAPGSARRRPGHQPGVDRDGQGAEAARLRLRRAHHRLRHDAGRRSRQRPPRGVCLPPPDAKRRRRKLMRR